MFAYWLLIIYWIDKFSFLNQNKFWLLSPIIKKNWTYSGVVLITCIYFAYLSSQAASLPVNSEPPSPSTSNASHKVSELYFWCVSAWKSLAYVTKKYLNPEPKELREWKLPITWLDLYWMFTRNLAVFYHHNGFCVGVDSLITQTQNLFYFYFIFLNLLNVTSKYI